MRYSTVMRMLWAVPMLVGACAHIDRAALVASTAALACDWGQTRRTAIDGWGIRDDGKYYQESNPILGPFPTSTYLGGYFGLALAANAMLWFALPRGWRSAVPTAVTTRETWSVVRNAPHAGVCGL